MQGIYDPNLVVDFLGCAQLQGTFCVVGSHGDMFSGWNGKVYLCDSAGNTLHQDRHVVAQHDLWYTNVSAIPGSGYAVTGYAIHQLASAIMPVLTLLDTGGNVLSSHRYLGNNLFNIPYVLSSGNSVLLAFTASLVPGNSNICLLKTSAGIIQNQLEVTTDSNGVVYEDLRALSQDNQGNIYILGQARLWTMAHQYSFLHKVDSSLNLSWTLSLPDTSYTVWDIEPLPSGNLYLYGAWRNGSGNREPFLSELDSAGNVLWTKSYSSQMINYYTAAMTLFPTGEVLLIGAEEFNRQGKLTITSILVDSNGQVLFASNFYGIGYEIEAFESAPTQDGCFLIAGRNTTGQAMIIKQEADALSNCYDTLLSVTEVTHTLPANFIVASVNTSSYQAFSQVITGSPAMNKAVLCFTTDVTERQEHQVTYANPISENLRLDNLSGFDQVAVYDISGRCKLKEKLLGQSSWDYNTVTWPQGMFLVSLQGLKKHAAIRIVKY